MKQFILTLTILLLCMDAFGAGLRGSRFARKEAFNEAKKHNFSFLESEARLKWFLDKELLVKLVSEVNYEVDNQVSYPYVRPEVRIFVQHLSEYLVKECSERMVITSALRLTTRQPRNASPDSVHPTGMALDIRRPNKKCQKKLEVELLYLEERGFIQATKEYRPPHYHVVVYPKQYSIYIANLAKTDLAQYEVRDGDSLSTIAKRFDTTIRELVTINGLDSPDFLKIGQKIRLR